VRDRRQTPENHRQRITQPRPQAVHKLPHDHHAQGIGCLKRKDKIAVVDFVPAKIVLQGRLENAQDLAVHVVLGDTEQQQSADHPAEVTNSHRSRPREIRAYGLAGRLHAGLG
jgi:hypothetical protein